MNLVRSLPWLSPRAKPALHCIHLVLLKGRFARRREAGRVRCPAGRVSQTSHSGGAGAPLVASGQKSFSDVLGFWKQSSGHRTNLLRPNVTAIGVAMAKTKSGRPYWTLVLGAE